MFHCSENRRFKASLKRILPDLVSPGFLPLLVIALQEIGLQLGDRQRGVDGLGHFPDFQLKNQTASSSSSPNDTRLVTVRLTLCQILTSSLKRVSTVLLGSRKAAPKNHNFDLTIALGLRNRVSTSLELSLKYLVCPGLITTQVVHFEINPHILLLSVMARR